MIAQISTSDTRRNHNTHMLCKKFDMAVHEYSQGRSMVAVMLTAKPPAQNNVQVEHARSCSFEDEVVTGVKHRHIEAHQNRLSRGRLIISFGMVCRSWQVQKLRASPQASFQLPSDPATFPNYSVLPTTPVSSWPTSAMADSNAMSDDDDGTHAINSTADEVLQSTEIKTDESDDNLGASSKAPAAASDDNMVDADAAELGDDDAGGLFGSGSEDEDEE